MNILFVCSRNQWRSPTAEKVFKQKAGLHVRSAGTLDSARIKISAKLMQWAEIILVMEQKHKQILISRFGALARKKKDSCFTYSR